MRTETVAVIYDRRRRSQTATTERAVELLRKGEVVALPTETVYGLAADALDPIAVAKIFEAKDRPRFDPLIVHLPDEQWLEHVAKIDKRSLAQVKNLIAKFWPGPLTLVFDRHPIVPEIVTAGLDTVAVRMSSHPVFAEIISAFGKPLAAPSANRFGRISPTTAQHVFDELSGRIPLIIDAGPTMHGIESTIVAVREDKVRILRRGPITEEELRGIGFQPIPPGQNVDFIRGIGSQPMDPCKEIQIRRGAYLPHWTQEGATYAVTLRLADALPDNVVADWEAKRREIVARARRQNREPTQAEEQRLAELFSQKVESYLDAGHGKCWLRDKRIAKIVRDALLHFQGKRYDLVAWCVMPNHVHVIVRPMRGRTLSEILHTWKSFTAQRANRLLHRAGKFWQPESYDCLVRNERDLRNQVRYVIENPEKTGLKSWPWVSVCGIGLWPMSDRQDADATMECAPGQLSSHYAPERPLQLVDDATSFIPKPDQRVALLAWKPAQEEKHFALVRYLSPGQDLREAAANLFRYLRELDAREDVDLIVAERVPAQGLGAAILDRLERASHDSGIRDTPE